MPEPIPSQRDHKTVPDDQVKDRILPNAVGDEERLHRTPTENVDAASSAGKVGQREVPVQRYCMADHHKGPHATFIVQGTCTGDQGGIVRGQAGHAINADPTNLLTKMRALTRAALVMMSLGALCVGCSGVGVSLTASWYLPVDDVFTWEAGAGLHVGPLSTTSLLTGEANVPLWNAWSAEARSHGISAGWLLVWDTAGPTMRYVQADVEGARGNLVSKLVWAWADTDDDGTLLFGAWARVGWLDTLPAGWAAAVDLGATPAEQELLGPARTFTVPYTPTGTATLTFQRVTLSAWWPGWEFEASFTVPLGLERLRLAGQVRVGPLALAWEQLFTRDGLSLTLEPGIILGRSGLTVYTELAWEPPLRITGFRVLGLTLECAVGNAWLDAALDLVGYGLVEAPYYFRGNVRVPIARGTCFSLTLWLSDNDILWGWSKTDVELSADAGKHVSLSTGISVGPEGLLSWKAGLTLRLGSSI